jgi:hypothetical protein
MKKLLLKMFYACLSVGKAFLIMMMFSFTVANAQIIYTDVNPDSTFVFYTRHPGSVYKNYNLDLNNDGNNDYTLTASASSTNTNPSYNGRRIIASPLNGNAVKDTLVNSDTVSIPLQFNALIDINLSLNQSWQTSGWNILKDTTWYSWPGSGVSGSGLWNNLSDYYLGLRLLQSGQTYYGWVRLRVDVSGGPDSLIIQDYAYNSIPNQPILAGQTTTTGINENSFASSINLFPNPANNHVTITLGSSNKKVEVTIADITGKIIYSTTESETQKVEVSTKDFTEGIYVVQSQSAYFIGTKKLVVEK